MNNPVPNVFDPQNAAALVEFAADAYSLSLGRGQGEGEQNSNQASTESQPTVIEDARTDTRVVIYKSETDTVIAFRGTADVRNWLTDFDARLLTENDCRIHAGFAKALTSVEGQLRPEDFDIARSAAFRRSLSPAEAGTPCAEKRLWLTGHSLGGALALLYAWRFVTGYGYNPFAGIYTFGQPRVGDAAFRDSYNEPLSRPADTLSPPSGERAGRGAGLLDCTWRVVNAVDIVPHVPWLLGCYRHAGHEVFYDPTMTNDQFSMANSQWPFGNIENRSLNICHWQLDRPAWLYAASDLKAMANVYLHPFREIESLLADHHVARYVNLLATVAASRKSAADIGGCLPTSATPSMPRRAAMEP